MASAGTVFDSTAMAIISAQDTGLKAAMARIAELESALGKIASCEKRCDGDVVDIAREALKK